MSTEGAVLFLFLHTSPHPSPSGMIQKDQNCKVSSVDFSYSAFSFFLYVGGVLSSHAFPWSFSRATEHGQCSTVSRSVPTYPKV